MSAVLQDNTVWVRLEVRETVRYARTVRMSRARFETLRAGLVVANPELRADIAQAMFDHDINKTLDECDEPVLEVALEEAKAP